MQAIALAGGLGPFAAKQRIQLHRKIKGVDSIFIFDYNAYVAGHEYCTTISIFNQATSLLFLNEACLNEMCG